MKPFRFRPGTPMRLNVSACIHARARAGQAAAGNKNVSAVVFSKELSIEKTKIQKRVRCGSRPRSPSLHPPLSPALRSKLLPSKP
jgi:hypothetical protein